MSQPRSASEVATNILLVFGLSVLVQLGVFPVIGIRVALAQSLHSGLVFTLLSGLRLSGVRRAFAWFGRRGGIR